MKNAAKNSRNKNKNKNNLPPRNSKSDVAVEGKLDVTKYENSPAKRRKHKA